MRQRIGQIASGKFDCVKPVIKFSEEKIEVQVIEGNCEAGSFVISCSNQMTIRGVIYSTNSRMECLNPQFEGEEIRIRYKFNSEGLCEGDKETGTFEIVCNQCKYRVNFDVTITKAYPESSIGIIKSLKDFSSLAKENWEEAYQIFYHKSFVNLIDFKETKEMMIYKGIYAAKPSSQNLEEFLVGINQKSKIEIEINNDSFIYDDFRETLEDSFIISKNMWGYTSCKFETDCEFIRLSKPLITTEDFIGNSFTYNFGVDESKLHAGNNYGRIYITTPYKSLLVNIEVHLHKNENIDELNERKQIKDCKVGIMELYQAYRLKRIVTGVWSNETVDILNHLNALLPGEPMYRLMKAQAYIINRQRQEAEWILSDFKREWDDHEAPIWGYYLYLMTLMEREPSYVDRMTNEIEDIFNENPDSILLFWVLTFLKEDYYNNNSKKLKAIESWIMNGCSSPYLYIEAYYILLQEPYLLNKLSAFELRVLRWAVRNHAISKEISEQIFSIIEVNRQFNKVIFEILCGAYEVNPKPENVGMICSYLIRGQVYDNKAHEWYEKGIELELRITGLYEAYLLSMDDRKLLKVPKIIQMYFQYESNLSYKKMAVLYNNINAAKNTNSNMYEKYRNAMSKFAFDQALQRHMDDNLAVLYDDMLELGVVNEELAHSLASILFMHKLIVFDKKMVRAIVYQGQLKDPQIVPIVDCYAYFQVYSNDYIVLFEDEKGHRYVNTISYQLQELIEPDKYLNKCIDLAPDEIPYIISILNSKNKYFKFDDSDKKYFKKLIFSELISEEYKAIMLPEIIRYYQNNNDENIVKELLMKANYNQMTKESRNYLINVLVKNKQYSLAFELVHKYGIDQINDFSKVSITSHMIREAGKEEDDFLLTLSSECYKCGKYDDVILDYLCEYYIGPTDNMVKIWESALNFDVDTKEIEERILIQAMYSSDNIEELYKVFKKYNNHNGREIVILAYISFAAHEYFVAEKKINSEIFEIIKSRYLSNKKLNDACKLALFKFLADNNLDGVIEYKILDELLSEYIRRNMYFAFYKKLNISLISKYHLYDKVFLEYRTNPANHVVINYSRDEDGNEFLTEDMTNIYDGVFVKQFVMFFGEMIQYYIYEEYEGQTEIKKSNRICNNSLYNIQDESRYNLINQMLMSEVLKDCDSLKKNMQEYNNLSDIAENAFKII